jgi:hypothetical protein
MRKKGIAFAQIAVYVESLGIETALKLVGGWGGLTLYVPGFSEPKDPLILAALGFDGAEALAHCYGCQTLRIPELDLSWYANLVRVATFKRHGFSDQETMREVGLSRDRVKELKNELAKASKNCRGPL